MSGIIISRKEGESDAEWAAVCNDMARALAIAFGMEHLLPNALAAGARSDETNEDLAQSEGRQSGLKGNAHD